MSQLVRDTYQPNGLIRSLGHSNVASSQTSLQKMPASSPQFLYQATNSNQQQQQQQIQFSQAPQNLTQFMPQNVPMKNDQMNQFNPLIVPQQQHQQQSQAQLNNMAINMMPQQTNGISTNNNNNNLTQQTILMSPVMSNKQENLQLNQTPQYQNQMQQQQYSYHQLPQQQQILNNQLQIQQVKHLDHNQQQPQQQQILPITLPAPPPPTLQQQQQVPMTTIMIPSSAAAQIQSASLQIQQAASQACANNPHLQQTPQILVFMIPYMLNQLPPTIPPTPEQNNPTIVRHSQSNSSMIRHSHQQQQQPQSQSQQQLQQPQHQQQQQMLSNSHSRAVSSLSNNVKLEAEKFYIKTNFSYQASRNRQELSFQKGDILHVLDTLLNNKDYGVQYWLATRVKANGEDAEKGLIPNKQRADEIALEQRTMNVGENNGTLDGNTGGMLSASVGRVNFLKRRAAQRSKSLCKDNWDNVVFDIGSFKLPTYERVVFKHPGFCRPVVIFGPLSDIAREKLLRDYSEKYSYPTGLNQSSDHPKVIRLKGVLEIIDQGKHALLDITAPAVEKLNYVNLAPIVIFMKTDSKSIIKDFRSRAAKSLDPNACDEDTLRRDGKSSRKLLEQSMKLEKQWSHIFTATMDLSAMGSEMWYRKLRETIENQQSANVWMSDKKSDKKSTQSAPTNTTNNLIGSNLDSNDKLLFPSQTNVAQTNGLNNHHEQQQSSCVTTDSTSMLNEQFNDCLNISNTKSANDLLPLLPPPSELTNYGNRSQLRNAYAHSLAQKLARASSEPKLNGLLSDHDECNDDDDDEDDDDDDDEIIKKPFPNEYENSSSISSSNGAPSYGQCSLTGPTSSTSAYQAHYQLHQTSHQPTILKPPAPPPPSTPIEQSINGQMASRSMHPQQQQPPPESLYSTRNPSMITNSFANSSTSINQHNRDYYPLPPMTGDNNYSSNNHHIRLANQNHIGHLQGNNVPSSAAAVGAASSSNSIIDLSRNHDARNSAFHVYSDMNQNNHHYFDMNKI